MRPSKRSKGREGSCLNELNFVDIPLTGPYLIADLIESLHIVDNALTGEYYHRVAGQSLFLARDGLGYLNNHIASIGLFHPETDWGGQPVLGKPGNHFYGLH